MRRTLILGLAGAMMAPSLAFAQQFGEDRLKPAAPAPAPAPAQPPAAYPSFPTGTPAPTPGVRPVAAVAPAVQTHPWAAKAEHGPWMICIKSYSDKGRTQNSASRSSEQLAVELTTEIRTQCKAAAYVYEWGSEDRAREMARQEEYRRQIRKEYEPFLALQHDLKAKADAQGVGFIETPAKYKLPTIEYTTQWGVFVGGFKDMETARKALDVVRLWSPPKAQHLMDRAVMANEKVTESAQKKATFENLNVEHAFLNPYTTAIVVPNPAIRSDQNAKQAVDPALVMFNKEEPLSLLKTRKKYTLMVKGFTIPTTVQPKDVDGSVIGRIFNGDEAERILEATARQARSLAESLRNPEMKPYPFESYVLHMRTGSIVTVGQYDSIEDPQLIETLRVLIGMTFEVHEKDPKTGKAGRVTETRRMFDAVLPMAVPR